MKIILFGNRGSRPIGASAGSPFEQFGGDTSAIGVVAGDQLVALDTGSGFWKWPYTLKSIFNRAAPYKLNVFYSHYHDDHTMGIAQSPFLFDPRNTIDIYGPDFDGGPREVFNQKANRPHNPDLSRVYRASHTFHTLSDSDPVHAVELADGMKVSWIKNPHGFENSYGYRIEHGGQTLAYITDTHHQVDVNGAPVLSPAIVDFIRGADVLIYDSHFSDGEYATNTKLCQDMGHSTGEQGVRLAKAAGIPIMVKHHHDPNKIDAELTHETAALKAYGQARGVAVVAAQPSLCIDLSLPAGQRAPFIEAQKTPAQRYAAIAAQPPA